MSASPTAIAAGIMDGLPCGRAAASRTRQVGVPTAGCGSVIRLISCRVNHARWQLQLASCPTRIRTPLNATSTDRRGTARHLAAGGARPNNTGYRAGSTKLAHNQETLASCLDSAKPPVLPSLKQPRQALHHAALPSGSSPVGLHGFSGDRCGERLLTARQPYMPCKPSADPDCRRPRHAHPTCPFLTCHRRRPLRPSSATRAAWRATTAANVPPAQPRWA